jgi:hypothetical protein
MNPLPSFLRRAGRRAGFTIVEIMWASAVSLIVIGGAMWLVTYGTASTMQTSNISSNDLTQWGLTNRLILDSRVANGMTVYSDFNKTKIQTEGSKGILYYTTPVRDHGNLLVLSRTATANMGSMSFYVERIIGYYYTSATKQLWKFEMSAEGTNPIITEEDQSEYRTVAELLYNHFGQIKPQLIASNVDASPISSTSGAFYRRAADQAILSLLVGDSSQLKKAKDTRLIEVSFFIRP